MPDTSQLKYPFHIFQNDEQIEVLFKIFDMKDRDLKKLENNISKLLLPAGGLFQSGIDYNRFLHNIASNRNIKMSEKLSIPKKEKRLFEKISLQNLEKMPEADRLILQEKLISEAKKNGLSKNEMASVSALTTIGAAQLSGFGVYLLASSTVGAITSLVGITLPFAFYTGMSSAISVLIGPVGFILAAIPLYKTFKNVRSFNDAKKIGNNFLKGLKTMAFGNYELAEIIFSYFASVRLIEIHKYDLLIEEKSNELANQDPIIKNFDEQVNIESDKSRSLMKKTELLRNELRKAEEKLNEQYAQTRIAGNHLAKAKKEKLLINDAIHSINLKRKKLLN